ncbi:MAG: hypothetical protein WCO69_00155 [Candidatus Omnitrophota bacterium]
MKQMLMAVLVVLALVPVSFAQPAPAAKVPAAVTAAPGAAVEAKIFTGKVRSIVLEDPAKGTKSSVVVASPKGERSFFQVTSVTQVQDAAGQTVALGSLANGTEVLVGYVLKDNVREAALIKVVKE